MKLRIKLDASKHSWSSFLGVVDVAVASVGEVVIGIVLMRFGGG